MKIYNENNPWSISAQNQKFPGDKRILSNWKWFPNRFLHMASYFVKTLSSAPIHGAFCIPSFQRCILHCVIILCCILDFLIALKSPSQLKSMNLCRTASFLDDPARSSFFASFQYTGVAWRQIQKFTQLFVFAVKRDIQCRRSYRCASIARRTAVSC